MKKRGLLMLVSSLCLVFILAAPSLAQVIKLTFAEQDSEMAWGIVHMLKPWVKKVEDATKGRVKIDVFYSQTLAKGPDAWNAVKAGIADMAWCLHGYWPDMTPLSDVIALPSLPIKTGEKGSEALWRLYEKFPAIQREFKDVHVLHLSTADPRFIVTTKKQVKTMDDIKGLKIRVLGGPPTEQMKLLGAIPVLLPMPDTYLSLDKGVIDGTTISWAGVHGFRLFETVKYYTIAPLDTAYMSTVMNKQKWESLPKDIQQASTSVSGLEGARFWGKNWWDSAQEGVVEIAKKGGYTMIQYSLPPEEVEKWTRISAEPIWKAWVKKMETKGYPEAQQILNTTIDFLKQ